MTDVDGYPTEIELDTIRMWAYNDLHGLMEYIKPRWQYAESGYWTEQSGEYHLSTAGWSGNEDIIAAMQDNRAWWMMYWQSTTRGGHYVFREAI